MRSDIITLASRYIETCGRQVSIDRISTVVFGSGTKMRRMIAGTSEVMADVGERAIQWFSDHWPDAAEWPADIPRPAPTNPTHTEEAA